MTETGMQFSSMHCFCNVHTTASVTARLYKVIWEQAASPLLVADPLMDAAHCRSTVFARWQQCARPSNTRFLCHYHRKRHLDRSPPLQSWCRTLPTCHFAPPHFHHKFAPFRGGIWHHVDPNQIYRSHPTQQLKTACSIDRLSRFSTIHGRFQRTDRQLYCGVESCQQHKNDRVTVNIFVTVSRGLILFSQYEPRDCLGTSVHRSILFFFLELGMRQSLSYVYTRASLTKITIYTRCWRSVDCVVIPRVFAKMADSTNTPFGMVEVHITSIQMKRGQMR